MCYRHIVPISASIFIQLSSLSVFLSKFSSYKEEIQLKLILIPHFLLLTWSYLQRYHFQIKSHSQILGLGHQHTILRGAQLHSSPSTGTTMTHWKCCTRAKSRLEWTVNEMPFVYYFHFCKSWKTGQNILFLWNIDLKGFSCRSVYENLMHHMMACLTDICSDII